MSLFDQARQMMLSPAFFGETVSITRGDSVIASDIPAKAAGTSYQTSDRSGLVLHQSGQDFIVLADDLADKPAPRDVVAWNGAAYLVLAPSAGESCWRYHDRERKSIRIHTKLKEAVD